jgi:hypothetical protein
VSDPGQLVELVLYCYGDEPAQVDELAALLL